MFFFLVSVQVLMVTEKSKRKRERGREKEEREEEEKGAKKERNMFRFHCLLFFLTFPLFISSSDLNCPHKEEETEKEREEKRENKEEGEHTHPCRKVIHFLFRSFLFWIKKRERKFEMWDKKNEGRVRRKRFSLSKAGRELRRKKN